MKFCKCMKPRPWRLALSDLWDEVKEFVEEPSLDELSDISWAIGRIVAGLFGKVYFRMPGDQPHFRKVSGRMAEYGCVRSRRHLKDGRCPSED